MYAAVFLCGMAAVKRGQDWLAKNRPRGRRSSATRAADSASIRPANQLPVRGFNDLVEVTSTSTLVRSIERRTKLTPGNWQRDCLPVLEQFAEFVQMLPASECHHHAQPGGLLVHAFEVADAALTFRAGMEIPMGVGTEERKRDEHRWTVAVLLGALLHDVGKPVTDVQVTLFQEDPRGGRLWQPMAGSMRAFSAHWYALAFGDASERDYKAHGKLGALLMQSLVPQRTLRWLSESVSGDILGQLMAYLSGDAPDGVIGEIVKRADSDSVRRNLMHGPRTRFASARTRPLIERLMEALRRMLAEGAQLPLNRPGAAGWVHDGSIWFVCARLADEVREYLAQHESAQGVPGRDKNDRLFDTWQEHGAVLAAPDGGAVWRVNVRCEAWAPPEPLTVLRFPLDRLYGDPSRYPPNVSGHVIPVGTAAPAAPAPSRPPSTPSSRPSPKVEPTLDLPPLPPTKVAADEPEPPESVPAAAQSAISPGEPVSAPAALPAPVSATPLSAGRPSLPPATPPSPPSASETASEPELVSPAAEPPTPQSAPTPPSHVTPSTPTSDVLEAHEAADLSEHQPTAQSTPTLTLTAPLRPRERTKGHPQPPKMPSPAAQAFLAWLAQSVGTGDLRYNEDAAMVHFVPEGALLLSPEIFRRFLEVHRAISDGPIADLRAAHGDNAYKRLQNELAKSGFTLRNGDENLHYFQFVKADGSLSRTASFYLLKQPELLWNPVPAPNARIKRAKRTPSSKPLRVPEGASAKHSSATPARESL